MTKTKEALDALTRIEIVLNSITDESYFSIKSLKMLVKSRLEEDVSTIRAVLTNAPEVVTDSEAGQAINDAVNSTAWAFSSDRAYEYIKSKGYALVKIVREK